ncbi:MAG: Fe-S protein assembly chaperone HscA [Candidatus Paracaedibacteraceae bacterium]|nr:Fe-S protein assembly chaperone HscA [Candidatus Paracaedibacteraceae bacterium]
MFVQLLDPKKSQEPQQSQKTAIGIDLGTTHSVIALADDEGVRVLTPSKQNRLIPSVVSYNQGIPQVGKAALSDPKAIHSIKRFIGTANRPESGHSPIQVSSHILAYLKAQAEETLGTSVNDAVITVPAYFDEAARQETIEAAKIAGLKVLRLINEPTAAALAYGLDQNIEGIYAVYDLGGGTFDLSIIRFSKGVFQVIATAGDTLLGGDDVDQLIATELNVSVQDARVIKEYLSDHPIHPSGLTQQDLAALCAPLLDRTLMICRQALEDAKLATTDLSGIVLVGGSTRMPAVRQAVGQFFDQAPLVNLNPDEVVALGAALQAKALTHGSDTVLLDVTPLSLGIETMGGLVEKIIHRNSPIPAAIAQEFTTYEDGQDGMVVHVMQGEREFVKDCRSLATFTLTGIPPMSAGIARVRITFMLDVDGLLTVSAKEMTTGVSQRIDIRPSYGLNEDDLFSILKDNFDHGANDIEQRLLIETRLEAEQTMSLVTSALAQDGDLLTNDERQVMDTRMNDLQKSLNCDDKNVIKTQLQALEAATQDFADRRVNRNIKRALSGSHVDKI